MITYPTVNQSSQILPPKKALNKAFRKVKPNRTEIEFFKTNLKQLLDRINDAESEEFHKNLLIDFLKKTYFDPNHYINTKGRNDLVIHNGNKASSNVGVIIETKKPTNLGEMLSHGRLNTKAFQELVLYYLRERIEHKNLEIKHLIVTNINEWFIFDANSFEKAFAQNKTLVSQFNDFEAGRLAGKTTEFFYKEIAQPFIAQIEHEVGYTYFDIRKYEKPLRNTDLKDDRKLIALFKLLSPEHLIKLPFKNDSNSLDKQFYGELLHIIGLMETKQGGKKLIERQPEGKRSSGSLLENAITQLETVDKISRLPKPSQYGTNYQEQVFNVALTLSITWLNRILFLKLLEAQLLTYHKGDKSYEFLSLDRIADFDDLNGLFFQVLARDHAERSPEIKELFRKVPYLNSSLFEPTDLEHAALFISNLRDDQAIPLYNSTVLKDQKGKRRSGNLGTLEYMFEFLKAYDFSSEGGEDVQEDNKTLINASVLGLIFEKINGYKDGSFFTPGFITMYMCKETIRKAVVQKFNESKGWNCNNLDDVYDKIEDRTEANQLINSLKVCDPAVGSGHFLVSALNEIIAVKNDLRILEDRNGKRLKEYQVEVVNDELIITDEDGELFEYNPTGRESQRVQEALFHEKQRIIESCLFGVDINPNSVKICRLRLWIELLKNAYYKNETELETLPNIDINIKVGNSLICRFALDADLGKALKKSAWSIESYQSAVNTYRRAESKEQKREMERIIRDIKSDFRSEISANDPKIKRRDKLKGEIFLMNNQTSMFEMSKREKAAWNKKLAKHSADLKKLELQIQEIKDNKIYENAFEWRFEFPEVLNEKGEYVGFDVVIGNPPYIRHEEIKELKPYLSNHYTTYTGTADIYIFFVERSFQILKDKGAFTFIMPNKFMQAGYGKPTREFLLTQNLLEILDFGDLQVFEGATTYPCILIAAKEPPATYFNAVAVSTLDYNDNFMGFVSSLRFELEHQSLTSGTWMISRLEEQSLLEKVKGIGEELSKYLDGEANYGVKPGLSKAFFIDKSKREEIILKDENSKELIKPLLRGRDITPWFVQPSEFYLISTFPSLNISIEAYPGIKDHLLSFGKTRLEQSGKTGSRKKTSGKWFETQDSIVYWREFEKPKIMYQKFQVRPNFIYDTQGLYCNDSMWIIPSEDKVLLGILNSKIGWWLISKYCTAIQNGYQLIWKYFSQIPIATGTEEQRLRITEVVDLILTSKEENPNADISALELQINELVYELYGLTEEEIEIVENS